MDAFLQISGFIVLASLVSACGFQMRGSHSINSVNISRLNLISRSADELSREIRGQLQLAGVDINPAADLTLVVVNENYQRTVLTVSPDTGKVEEYLLTLTVMMSLAKESGGELLSNELINTSREFLYDEDTLLGKASEEALLKETLRREAAGMIIRRMNAASRNN